jgi:hypothetical protein
MMRLAVLFAALVALATAVPAGAQTPPPEHHHTALEHKATPMTFTNPANPKNNPGTRSGRDCISGRGANAAQQTVDPVTGKPRAATFLSVPLTKGGGSVASATSRSQQAAACAHTR